MIKINTIFKPLKTLFLGMCLIYSAETTAKTKFFHFKINFSEADFQEFYSSFSIDNSRVYFNATDYTLCAYDINTKQLVWKDSPAYCNKEPIKKKEQAENPE